MIIELRIFSWLGAILLRTLKQDQGSGSPLLFLAHPVQQNIPTIARQPLLLDQIEGMATATPGTRQISPFSLGPIGTEWVILRLQRGNWKCNTQCKNGTYFPTFSATRQPDRFMITAPFRPGES